MTDWYYADATHTRQGPIPAAELLRLSQAGRIDDRTLVWRDGLAEWVTLDAVRGELDGAGATAPAASEWTLEALAPTPPPGADDAPPAPGDAWRPVTESAVAAVPAAGASEASPYAPPTAPLARADTVVHGGEVVYAGFWKRLAAYFIDAMVVGMASMLVAVIVGGFIGGILSVSGVAGDLGFALIQILANLLSLAVTAVYYAWFHASNAMATPGKMAVGIKVVRTSGERISLLRGIGRYFATVLSAMILMIGFLMAGFTQRKQALHDMVCDTLVVDKWAFTDRPELQRRELGTVTVVVLAIFGALFGLALLVVLAAIGFAAM
ncbi:RDD family protein [Luteimonas sp. FCS-9]|uniref:RDD family protein n=1 Tax=Luteimonas sp. FCS-9 TaxID=1547516 RepID=UPI00063EA6DD|nr:RDD family protein [Luteimonas sp. FCS-9]KLJ00105.1 hypothetical protein WQ56_10335 [Luteimonas sp. FCS-9]